MRTCETCRYFAPSALAQPTCRRNAPQVVSFAIQTAVGQQVAVKGAWPTTQADDWCGEWQEKRMTTGES
jgi:hypothetical protein